MLSSWPRPCSGPGSTRAATSRCPPAVSGCSARLRRAIRLPFWPTCRRACCAADAQLKMQETLRLVGHTYHEVASLTELQASVETGQFNIVVADLGDAADLQRNLRRPPRRVVPVAYKLTKSETREAAKQSRFLIKRRAGAGTFRRLPRPCDPGAQVRAKADGAVQ